MRAVATAATAFTIVRRVCSRVSLPIISVPEIVLKLSRSWWQGLLVIAAVAAASVLTLISLRDFQREAVPPENRPIQSQIAGYVSSNACRACHPGNYASWHASFHRTMTQVATPQSLPPEMDELELAFNGREYKMERRGDKFFVRTRSEGGSYGEPQQVVLVTGSYNLQILWLEIGEGRTLQQFPFGYIVAEKIWAPVSETFLLPPNAKEYYSTGAWNGACMDCHVTQGQSRFVAGNKWESHHCPFERANSGALHSQVLGFFRINLGCDPFAGRLFSRRNCDIRRRPGPGCLAGAGRRGIIVLQHRANRARLVQT